MTKSKRGLRLAVGGAVLGTVYLGLAASATAWDEPLWVRQLGTEEYDLATGVVADAAGNVYVTGSARGSLGGRYRGLQDAWVVKYDAAGQVLWKRQLGTEEADVATGVATDPKGDIYLTGSTDGSLGSANRGASDAWVAKYDAAGHAVWVRQFGTDGVPTGPEAWRRTPRGIST